MKTQRSARVLQLLAGCCLIFLACTAGNRVKLPVTRDTVAWMYRGEPTFDFGAAEPLFVEGVHYCALLGFDVSAARGRRVASARLWLHRVEQAPVLKLVLGTISEDWLEGGGTGRGTDRDASCAAYVRIDPETRRPVRWAGPGSDITDVIFSHGNTLVADSEVRQESGGWQSVAVPRELAEALVCGVSYGLVLMDAKGQQRDAEDHFIFKRFNSHDSGGFAPYLEVVLEPAPGSAPGPVAAVQVSPAPQAAGLETGALQVLVSPPAGAAGGGLYYEMAISASPLDKAGAEAAQRVARRLLPRVGGRAVDTVLVNGLPPSKAHWVAVRTMDCCGRVSDWVPGNGESSPAQAPAALASPPRPGLGGQIRVWACGVDEKVNPVSGRLLEENPGLYVLEGDGDYEYKYDSHLWNSGTSTVSLDVPRGGTAAFQLIVEPAARTLDNIQVRADPVFGAGTGITARLYRDWYLKSAGTGAYYPEVALPLAGAFSIPDPENEVEGQRNQAVLVEYYVPRSARPGTYLTRVLVGARGLMARTVNLRLTIHQAELPARLPFIGELNCYGPVSAQYDMETDSDEYFDLEQQYYRMAHDHLCVINQLPYRQNGEVLAVGAPVLEGEGAQVRVADWSRWDRRWGRYLDGSAFAESDRQVPVPVMYLPFHENWPGTIARYYRFTPTDTSYVGMINEHALKAPPIEEAFDPAYEEAFVGVLKQFAEHFRRNGWLDTEFQVYFNNKYYRKRKEGGGGGDGSAWWLLDEPYQWDDFLALAYYGALFTRAVGDEREANIVYRMDISRPHLQFGLLDGLRSVTYASSYFYTKNAYLAWRKKEFGEDIRNYGSFNRLEESNLTATAWPVKVWLNNGSGLLPWQTIGSDRNFDSFSATAVLYPGRRFGIEGPVASLRLKAARQGIEDAVLLEMLAERHGWKREQAALAVAGRVDLGGRTITGFFDDAGEVAFDDLSPEDLAALRMALLRSLDM
ncbi:MAG: DUF4091 domain-containing protein [Candidatus Glassbacteria bacterium]|nr:DUF4091 domain-containing protein [Candidatus Glassbacteria bacterium]